jgi:nucleotide-binding universal stress UspA family protein
MPSSSAIESHFRRILVPLDGSHLAETALPAAALLANWFQSRVTLIHLVEQDAPSEVHSERHLTGPAEAQDYLRQVAQRAFRPGGSIDIHVHTAEINNVARSLVEHAGELQADLIVMCAHGHGGLRGWLFGSIAQQVVNLGATPVLLIRPTADGEAPPFGCRLILVPLDGDPVHEVGLPFAAELAQASGGALHLVMVVRDQGRLKPEEAASALLMPLASSALVDLSEKQAETYLNDHIGRLRAAGLTASGEVARGDPAPYLSAAVQRVGADLAVLATHGKAGLGALLSGSVAPRLSGQSHAPLLLVPLAGQSQNAPG